MNSTITSSAHSSPTAPAWVEQAWTETVRKIERTSRRIGATFPHVSKGGRYDDAPPHWWTNGFWPGLLWLVQRETHDERLAEFAIACEDKLDRPLAEYYQLDHDVGFMWGPTSVARFRLTGHPESRRRGLIAASHLASRFNPHGRFFRAWNWHQPGVAIIDCLMNLPLLFWASRELKDPRYRHMAVDHADTVLRHFLRSDGTSRHIVALDPDTGEFVESMAGQGFGAESAWSRGNAWALYGLALAFRHSGEARFLEAAKRVAGCFLAQLPDDHVPHWDFSAPRSASTPRDSSAGAIAASGLLEISQHVAPAEAAQWRQAATRITRSLFESYGAWDTDEEALLLKATGNLPGKDNIEVPLIYGDYYFVESLVKLRRQEGLFW